MQVYTSLQTDNHASTPPLSVFYRPGAFLPPNQQRQSTEGKTICTMLKQMPKSNLQHHMNVGTVLPNNKKLKTKLSTNTENGDEKQLQANTVQLP